jgi:hypothetical protein
MPGDHRERRQDARRQVVDWCRRSAHHTEYETFAARMPCKRTLAKRMHLNSNIKTKARKKHVASVDPNAISETPPAAGV